VQRKSLDEVVNGEPMDILVRNVRHQIAQIDHCYNADNETGYRVYKNGSPLPDFPKNSTTFHITLRYDQGTGGTLFDNFGVEAFNSAGSSARIAVDVPKCP
jgi:hypothetical protein